MMTAQPEAKLRPRLKAAGPDVPIVVPLSPPGTDLGQVGKSPRGR